MPDYPPCPICQHNEPKLIATLKADRIVEIYLCEQCRTNFSYERASGKVKTNVQPT
jgi:hypothetical protein